MIDNNTHSDERQEIDTEDARQARRMPGLIWVLVGGIILAIVGFALSALFGAG
ncbi:hypothetical protein [Hyphomonas sp.]|jgi:hypothetical protein|uniref:hypothetical protein n=1 Tax=Hyphomonas sp. TaxID=87 RepID=UPI003568C6D9